MDLRYVWKRWGRISEKSYWAGRTVEVGTQTKLEDEEVQHERTKTRPRLQHGIGHDAWVLK
jgi:hypothetical protein